LSLRIKRVARGLDLDYCDECGSTDVDTTNIEEWQKLYRDNYGFDFLNKKIGNGRK
jgi:hypothetical protein